MKARAIKVFLTFGGLLIAGLVFAYGAGHFGWWIPCGFSEITGLRCPGCGVSRMCLAILQLDFKNAFYWNPLVFSLLPVLGYLMGYIAYRYIRYGDSRLQWWQVNMCWAIVIILLIFGVFRNLS